MDNMYYERLETVVRAIMGWCGLYGYDILRYPDNLRSYARAQMRAVPDAVDLCMDAVSADGFTDWLMWCRYFADDPEQLDACTDSFTEIVRAAGKPNPDQLETVLRLFAAQAAGTIH